MYKKIVAILKVVITVVILTTVLMPIVSPLLMYTKAQEVTKNSDEDRIRLMEKAMVLQGILRKTLTLNISQELLIEIEELVNTNITLLSPRQLEEYLAKCNSVLMRIEREVRRAWKDDLGNIYADRLRSAIEVRLRIVEKYYNISLEDELHKMVDARSLHELYNIVRVIERSIESAKAQRFASKVLRKVELVVNRVVENNSMVGVDRAAAELFRAIKILDKVVQKLERLNVSREAVDHIRIAIEHISMAKEVIVDILVNITSIGLERVKVKEFVNKTLEKLYCYVNETLRDIRIEVEELMERALELNATEVLEELEKLMQRIDNITQILQQTSITVEKLNEIISTLARIKLEVKSIERELEKNLCLHTSREFVEKAFNTTITKALKNLDEVKNIIEYLKNKSKEIVCITIYPPPPVCRYILILPQLLSKAEQIVAEAENMINASLRLYINNSKTQALHLAIKANTLLTNLRAWLEPIYNSTKLIEKPTENRAREELALRLERAIDRFKEVEKRLNQIGNRLEKARRNVRSAVERLLNELKIMISQVQQLINEASSELNEGNIIGASEAIAKVEALLKNLEVKLSILEGST